MKDLDLKNISKGILEFLTITDEVKVSKAAKGTVQDFYPIPQNYFGHAQERVGRGDLNVVGTRANNERMLKIALSSDTVAAIVNSVVDFGSIVPLRTIAKDITKTPKSLHVSRVQDILANPNPRMTGLELKKVTLRDLATFGYAAWEIVRTNNLEFYPIDITRMTIDYDSHGTLLGFNQFDEYNVVIVGKDGIHTWMPDEVVLFSHDPVSYSGYSLGRISQLYSAAVIESLMLAYIGGKFIDSNIPYGVLSLGDLSKPELENAIEEWNMQASSPHRLLLTGSKGPLNYIPFNDGLDRLQAKSILADVRSRIMSVYGATPNEIAVIADSENGTFVNLSLPFKKRCVEAYLSTFCSTVSKRVVTEVLGYSELVEGYEPIDSKDAETEIDMWISLMKVGVLAPNEVRAKLQLPPIKGGDTQYLYTPTGAIPVSLFAQLAQAQLDSINSSAQDSNNQLEPGTSNNPITTPAPKAPKPQKVQAVGMNKNG